MLYLHLYIIFSAHCECSQRWFKGKIIDSHSMAPGSSPGRCTLFGNIFFFHTILSLLLIMTTFIAQPIICKAAVCWAPNQPLKVESIIVAPPKKGEVLVFLLYPVITPQSLIVILLYCYIVILLYASFDGRIRGSVIHDLVIRVEQVPCYVRLPRCCDM